MDADDPGWPLIDDVFRRLAEGRSPTTVRRHARVRGRLYAFLDTGDMALGLGTAAADLLDAERRLHHSGAFWSLYGPVELVRCLPSFVHETWLPPGLAEASAQVSLVSRLLRHLDRPADVDGGDMSGAMAEAEHAVAHARRALLSRATTTPTEPPRMPDRFRQHPGPTW